MAERDIMKEYMNVIKCTFISEKYVIFDYEVKKCHYYNDEDNPIKADGNIIINSKLEANGDGRVNSNSNDNIDLINREVEKAVEKCKKSAEWIFSGMDNDIDNEN